MSRVATWFLCLSAVTFLLVYALPLLFCPLRWARAFRWTLPQEGRDLTVYLGRCVGALAVTIVAFALRAAARPEQSPWIFEVIAVAGALMTGVHVWGALRRQQPWTEDAEILLYLGLSAAALWIRHGLPPG